jgi:nicotinate-nucleotide adenylyltransferase
VETRVRRVGSAAALLDMAAGRVLELAVTPLELSASYLRAEFAAGREPRYLVPEAVLAYIRAHGLYDGT